MEVIEALATVEVDGFNDEGLRDLNAILDAELEKIHSIPLYYEIPIGNRIRIETFRFVMLNKVLDDVFVATLKGQDKGSSDVRGRERDLPLLGPLNNVEMTMFSSN